MGGTRCKRCGQDPCRCKFWLLIGLCLFLAACTDIDPAGTWRTQWRYIDGSCGLQAMTTDDVMTVEESDNGYHATIADASALVSVTVECGDVCDLESTRIATSGTTTLALDLHPDDSIIGHGSLDLGTCQQAFTVTGTHTP